MNYSDFDKIEQDEWSLTRPTFPTSQGEFLTVIGVIIGEYYPKGRTYKKNYIVCCPTCLKDPALFGEGIFRTTRQSLLKGHVPCGCGSNTKWTGDQNRIRISREVLRKGGEVIYEDSCFDTSSSKVRICCTTCGGFQSKTVNKIMNSEEGICTKCSIKRRSDVNKKSHVHLYEYVKPPYSISLIEGKGKYAEVTINCREHGDSVRQVRRLREAHQKGTPACSLCSVRDAGVNKRGKYTSDEGENIKEFFKTGKFRKGYKFRRLPDQNWECVCPVCSQDRFVKNGLCIGTFLSQGSSLKRGHLPCRCSKVYNYTEEQWTLRVREETKVKDHTFVEWAGKPSGKGRFKYLCPDHGTQETTAASYLLGGGCPICSGNNQRQCYINQVLDEDLVVALKFGISKNALRRLRDQNSTNLFGMEQMGVWEFPSVKSCKAAEKQCKKELDCGILTKRELKDGWSETTHIKNLDRIIEIYENHGGKRINTKEERKYV